MLKERLKRGVAYLEKLGYRVELGKAVFQQHGYLAGDDQARLNDLHAMLADPQVHAVFSTRGGYGTPRLLEAFDYQQMQLAPKILVGYSDLTALQLAVFARTGVVTFSGPMVAVEMANGLDLFTERHFWPLLTDPHHTVRMSGTNGPLGRLRGGVAEGTLLGGCLSLVCTLLGTPFQPDFRGAILFLEDVGEEPYQLDRKLMQLKLAGVLQQISGLVLGRFEDCVPKGSGPSLTLEQVWEEVLGDLPIPIATDLPYGHVPTKYTLPIGVRARLDADAGLLEILEPSVAGRA